MKARQRRGGKTPVLTEELAGVLEVEDSCLEDASERAAVAAARKGPAVTRGRVTADPQSGRRIITLDVAGTFVEFKDSNTLDVKSSKDRQKKTARPATSAKQLRKSKRV